MVETPKDINKNDNLKRPSMHPKQGYFLSKQWGETQRFVIVGKEGNIAQELAARLKKGGKDFIVTSFEPVENDLYLQLEEPQMFNYDKINENDFIVFLAAISSPDVCKNQFDYAYTINVTGTKEFISNCLKNNARLLFISSDTVLGKAEGVVDEKSKPSPFGKYAEMKYEVEKYYEDKPNVKIFRLSYVFSRDDKFSKYVLNCIKKNKKIEIFHPFERRVVYIQDVIDAIIRLSENWDKFSRKIYHVVGPELLSRKDIVELYIRSFYSKTSCKIIDDDNRFFEDRARIINLNSLYIEELLGRKPTKIADAIEKEIIAYKEEL